MRAFARALPSLAALLLALPLGCASGAGTSEETPTLYKWVDQNGVAHYTTDPERIPSNLRHRIRDLEDEPRLASRPPRDAGAEASAGEDTAVRVPGASSPDAPRDAAEAERARASEPSSASSDAPSAAPGDEPTTAASEDGEAVTRPSLREAPEPATRGAPEIAARAPGGPGARRGDGARAAPENADGSEAEPMPRGRRAELDARIAALEAELDAKEERLKALISETQEPADGEAAPLYDNEELRSLARSFPQLQADLADLRAERRRLERER